MRHGPCWLTDKKIQAVETKCLRKLLCISHLGRETNEWMQREIIYLAGAQRPLLKTAIRREFACFGHVTHQDSLSKTILGGTLEEGAKGGVGGVERRGRQRKCWMNNIKEWTSLPIPELLATAYCGKDWKRISAESSRVSPRRHNRSKNWTELNWKLEKLCGWRWTA